MRILRRLFSKAAANSKKTRVILDPKWCEVVKKEIKGSGEGPEGLIWETAEVLFC
jgi:hypothetical protein